MNTKALIGAGFVFALLYFLSRKKKDDATPPVGKAPGYDNTKTDGTQDPIYYQGQAYKGMGGGF